MDWFAAMPLRTSRCALLCAVAFTGMACATAGPSPEQQLAQMREELSASRRAQEDLRGRLERLEARVDARTSATAAAPAVAPPVAPVPVVDPLQSLPVVKLEATRAPRGTGRAAPDVDTSIPLRDGPASGPVVLAHTVSDSEAPIDLNAVVARQSGSFSGKAKGTREAEDKSGDEFQSAVLLYNARQYAEAAEAFRVFAARHPKHPSASEAQFMGGTALASANRCLEGRPLFESVVRDRPGTDVATRSLLAMARCEANVGHEDAARTLFNRVVSERPSSTEAMQARSALAELSGGTRAQ